MTTTITRCECGSLSHEDQKRYFPVDTIVRAIVEINNAPDGEIPIGALGKVTAHCDDGRAWVRFDGYPYGHTFHEIYNFLRVAQPSTEQPASAAGSASISQDDRAEFNRQHVWCSVCGKGNYCDPANHQPPAPAAQETGEWWVVSPYSNDQIEVMTTLESHVAFCTNNKRGQAYAAQIVRDHNEHQSLSAERERLREVNKQLIGALREVAIPSLRYCEQKYDYDNQAALNLEGTLELIDAALNEQGKESG